MAKPPELDDDTSAGRITQGGRDRGHGRGLAWTAIALLILAVVAGYILSEHRTDQNRRGVTVVSHGL